MIGRCLCKINFANMKKGLSLQLLKQKGIMYHNIHFLKDTPCRFTLNVVPCFVLANTGRAFLLTKMNEK